MNALVERLRGGLIVSCQAGPADVLYGPERMAEMARAAELGGAVGVRVNGPADIAAVRKMVSVPILGIYKQDVQGRGIRITPSLEVARAVVEAGADLVALDATGRGPEEGRLSAAELIQQIKQTLNVPVMADISTYDEGIAAAEAGADIVATTLSGYTAYSPAATGPDYDLLERLARTLTVPVIAEGRIATPEAARRVLELGGYAMVVGSMITRPRFVVEQYTGLLANYGRRTERVIGVDIGGTKIACGAVDFPAQIAQATEIPTLAQEGGEVVMTRVMDLIAQTLRHSGGSAIGISTGGEVDANGGILYATGFMPGWQGIQIREAIGARFGLPVIVENDGQAATLAEALHGAGRDYRSVLGVTVGTGVGGGFVVDRKIYTGANRASLALGHISVEKDGRQCTCGQRGCLESYASGPALIADYNAHSNKQGSTGKSIRLAAEQGDSHAVQAIQRASEWLGYGLGITLNLLNPAVIVIGGGVAQIGDLFLDSVRQAVQRYAYPTVRNVPILPAALGPQAGLIGAADLAREVLTRR